MAQATVRAAPLGRSRHQRPGRRHGARPPRELRRRRRLLRRSCPLRRALTPMPAPRPSCGSTSTSSTSPGPVPLSGLLTTPVGSRLQVVCRLREDRARTRLGGPSLLDHAGERHERERLRRSLPRPSTAAPAQWSQNKVAIVDGAERHVGLDRSEKDLKLDVSLEMGWEVVGSSSDLLEWCIAVALLPDRGCPAARSRMADCQRSTPSDGGPKLGAVLSDGGAGEALGREALRGRPGS